MNTAVLLDIEGTVSPLSAVRDELFPYARRRFDEWMARPEVRREVGADVSVAQLAQWSDEDVKAGPLKVLQGLIWRAGFASGDLVATLYDEVPGALRAWRDAGVPVYIYSSGSVLAQQLWFSHTETGDLSHLISGYYDLATGSKREAWSYRVIAESIGVPTDAITFYSDSVAELDAADEAGMSAVGVSRSRDGSPDVGNHTRIDRFTELPVGSTS